jgi:hypothetical protein
MDNNQKEHLDKVMEDLQVQPVGSGYIDCICPSRNIGMFIDSLNKLDIKISELTWWCFVDDAHEACGLGGPPNRFGTGWYSEMPFQETLKFSDNEKVRNFLLSEWPKSRDYQACYTPGFWLVVPKEWRNPWIGADPWRGGDWQ